MTLNPALDGEGQLDRLTATLDLAIERLERSRAFAKERHKRPVLDLVSRLVPLPGGMTVVAERSMRMDEAGVFIGSDWDRPETLLPQLSGVTLQSEGPAFRAIEAISLARFVAVATGNPRHDNLHVDGARHFVTQVLALNLRDIFGQIDETARVMGARCG